MSRGNREETVETSAVRHVVDRSLNPPFRHPGCGH